MATLQNGSVYNIYPDHLGAPRVITNSANTVVWRWDSEPFGSNKANEDPDGNGVRFTYNLRFPGQYYDGETGKHYNYFRDYYPSTGRYVESDPIGLDGGMNTYAYALASPLMYMDSTGLAVPGGTDLGGGNSVRIDKPKGQPNQQTHAHFETPKGKGVVNIDGTGSHGAKANLQNLNKKMREFLKGKGFKLLDPEMFLLPNPFDIMDEYCKEHPFGDMCIPVPPPSDCSPA